MTYHHLTIDELTMIANFCDQGVKAYRAAKLLHRSLETVYRVYRFLAAGHTLQEYYQHYRENKAHCGRKAIQLPTLYQSQSGSRLDARHNYGTR